VPIAFDLVGRRTDVTVEFRAGDCAEPCPWSRARVKESTKGLKPGPNVLTWDAAADRLEGFNRLRLRVTPGTGREDEKPIEIGNDAPGVVVLQPGAGATLGQNVVIEFEVEDTAPDLVSVELWYSTDGDPAHADRVPSRDAQGNDSGLVPQIRNDRTESGEQRTHFLTWDSIATLGNEDFQGMTVGIQATDQYGASKGIAWSRPFDLGNNSPPQVVAVTEPAADPDGDSPVALRFTLRDAEEDPADVILQWSTDGTFPEIPELIADEDLRRRVLEDPAARPAWNIVTARPRTIAETRVRLLSPSVLETEPIPWDLDPPGIPVESGRSRRDPLRSELVLWGLDPPGALPPLVGSALELLSEGGAVEQILGIVAVDPGRHAVILDALPDPAPRQGQRARILANEGLVALETSSSDAGREHSLTWDVAADAPGGKESDKYFIRATAVTGVKPGLSFTTSVGKEITAFPLGFVEPTSLPLPPGSRPEHVIASDLNADGATDLVVAATQSNDLRIFLNAPGNGTFPESWQSSMTSAGGKPHVLAAADLDGDGAMDLVSGEGEAGSSPQISLYFGDGDGTFMRHETLATKGQPQALAIANFKDDDEVMDIVVTEVSAPCPAPNDPELTVIRHHLSLYVWRREVGGYVKTEERCLQVPPRGILAADVDANGTMDVVAAMSEGLQVLLGRGNGALEDPGETFTPDPSPEAVASADLDGDGDLDLASAGAPLRVALSLGDGSGSFRLKNIVEGTGVQPSALVAADLNTDGAMDLVGADGVSSQISIFLGLGDADYVSRRLLTTGKSLSALVASDLNGDAALDLVSADSGDDRLTLVLSPGEGELQAAQSLDTGSRPRDVLACDLDGDGRMDLVSVHENVDELQVFFGEGTGTFIHDPVVLHTEAGPRAIAAVDLDADGLLDLVSANFTTISLLRNGGDRSWPHRLVLEPGSTAQSRIATADLDGDGRPDLISYSENHKRISRFLAAGRDHLPGEPQPPITTNTTMSGMVVTDTDADGNTDIVLAGSELVLLRGHRDGTFEEERRLVEGLAAKAVAAADVDGDGAIDLVVADASGNLRVFLARDDGELETLALGTGATPSALVTGDFNMDGAVDLVSADTGSSRLSVFLGRGGGAFESHPRSLLAGDQPQALAAADINSDGALDLVSAESGSNRLSTYIGGVQRPLAPAFFGTRVPGKPPLPTRTSEALVLGPERPHRIHTSTGTIDGERWNGFSGRTFHFESLEIQEGATVLVEGQYPLLAIVSGDVTVDGELRLDGQAAEKSVGARGGPGGGGGGHGGGLLGTGTLRGMQGEGGGGGGGAGEPAASGGGAGFAGRGGAGSPGVRGGSPYGNDRIDPLQGGSGGGGGSAQARTSGKLIGAGGGGGGGGGALRLTAGGKITVRGKVTAVGGDGSHGSGGGGSGGGGSGGTILLEAEGNVEVSAGTIAAEGGKGGSGPAVGNGSPGRIVLRTAGRSSTRR
jgi:hypothetical protein